MRRAKSHEVEYSFRLQMSEDKSILKDMTILNLTRESRA